jgi:hypothetical protein
MFRPDLVVLRDGRPVLVAEAKGRAIEEPYHESVVRQLQAYSTSVNSPWALLADPQKTEIYRGIDFTRPVVTFSTGEILGDEVPRHSTVIGERTLVYVLDRWLSEIPRRRERLVARHPELMDFANDLSNHITTQREWWPGRPDGGRDPG